MTKLESLLNCINQEKIYVQMHNYPDQDAISSAFGLKALLERYGKEVIICYYGAIDKANTIKMIELLEIPMVEVDTIQWMPKDEIILVDVQEGNGNLKETGGKILACIDHHPVIKDFPYAFTDIRCELGSCASIVTEYFIENSIEVPKMIATALLYGIKIDTSNLTRRVTDVDIHMFSFLHNKASKRVLLELEQNSIQIDDLLAYQEAISTLRMEKKVGIAKIGDNCSEALIGTISDFLLTVEEIQIAVVYSYRVGGIKFSLRSESTSMDTGRVIKEAVEGYGTGGGHSTVAAGFIPDVLPEDVERISNTIIERILRIIEERKLSI